MKVCAGRGTSYLNGNSYDDCKKIAESINDKLKPKIKQKGKFMWSELLIEVNHDELDGKAARFVAAWNTESNDIDKLLKTIANK